MRDQKTRSTLIEAVIAGGLIAVGVATGQPLVALASSVAGVGGNWAHSLAARGFQCWRDRWFTDDGVLNHDISKALCHAFVDAVHQVEYDWKQQRQYQYLRLQRPEQAQLTLDALRLLREEGVVMIQQMHQLPQAAQQQQPDHVLSLMYQDESRANEYLKPVLATFLYGHDEAFVTFVTVQFGPKWILRFLEILKDPHEEGTRAWRACQMLWQKSLMFGIEQIQRTTVETADAVHWLQAWAQQLKSLPPTQRNSTGQEALDTILHSVRAQLSEMQNTLDKTYTATMDIKATTLDIKTTLAEIAPALQKSQSTVSEHRNRQRILGRVRSSWIRGMFEQSMEGATFIPLGLYDRPDLIENRWVPYVQEAKQTGRQLPAGTSLMQVYDEAEGELLILGEPGSGKTTLLLHLARELLNRADLDDTHLMPVVFNLSTWGDKRQPLAEWLVEELSTKYQIPQKIGKPWIEAGQVLPLLDGLDEVQVEYRGACVGAINAYRQQSLVPLVIGSRLAEYTAQASKIVVRRAVLVQPMTLQQIQEYLEKAEGQLDALQELLRDEPDFQELARNPLMLSILKRTYQGKKVHIIRNVSLEARRHQIFTDYVQHVFQHRSVETRYSPELTKSWLIWLAKQMKLRNQTEFYLERLQIDWLAKSRPGEIYTSLAFGLLSFPIAVGTYGLEYSYRGLQFAIVNGILAGFLVAVIGFFFVWFIETDIRVGTLFPRVKRGATLPAKDRGARFGQD